MSAAVRTLARPAVYGDFISNVYVVSIERPKLVGVATGCWMLGSIVVLRLSSALGTTRLAVCSPHASRPGEYDLGVVG